jgi:hypothetical protein
MVRGADRNAVGRESAEARGREREREREREGRGVRERRLEGLGTLRRRGKTVRDPARSTAYFVNKLAKGGRVSEHIAHARCEPSPEERRSIKRRNVPG